MPTLSSDQIADLALLAGLITGGIQIAKTAGFPSRFAGLLAILYGIGLAFLFQDVTREAAGYGLIAGLMSQGVYETVTLGRGRKPAGEIDPRIAAALDDTNTRVAEIAQRYPVVPGTGHHAGPDPGAGPDA